MSELLFESAPQTEAEYQAAVTQMLEEIERLHEKMCRDQADIDRLKDETERLRIEGQRLNAETRERIARLHSALDELGGTK